MFESILLGILQGLTEFLPISSSGHLVLAQELFSDFTGPAAAFVVLLHGGTLIAVLIYFRDDLLQMIRDLVKPGERDWHLPILLILGVVPAGLVGILLTHQIERLFSFPAVAATGLIVTSCVLLAAWRIRGRAHLSLARLTPFHALLIGAAQALAIIPGISRSGSTIAMGMFLGLSGSESAKFSFLLSIPAIAGALFLELDVLHFHGFSSTYLVGALVAALSGWASIAFLMKLLDRENLFPFAIYCLALGSLSIAFLV